MATGEENKQADVVSVELPAPAGWVKKCTRKKGGTPQRNDIVFTSPTGEEIRNKRQLDQYLKSHPGGPAANEFDWATGDTPRRSARLSEKLKEPEGPTSSSPRKRRKKPSIKESDEKINADADGETQETNEDTDVVVDPNEAGEGGVINEEAIPSKPETPKVEIETETEPKAVLDEPTVAEAENEGKAENSYDDLQKSSDVALNVDVEESNDTKNEKSKLASPEKEAVDVKENFRETVVADKNAEVQESETVVENNAQEPTEGS